MNVPELYPSFLHAHECYQDEPEVGMNEGKVNGGHWFSKYFWDGMTYLEF